MFRLACLFAIALSSAPAWAGEARMRAIEAASAASAKKNYAAAANLLDTFVEKQSGSAEAAGLADTARAYDRRAALQKAVPDDASVRALLLDLLAPSDPYLDAADELDPRTRELLATLRKKNTEAASHLAPRTVRVTASGAGVEAGAIEAFVAGAVARLSALGYAADTKEGDDHLEFDITVETAMHHAGTPGNGPLASALEGLKGCRFNAVGRWMRRGAVAGSLSVKSAGLHPDAHLGLLTAAETAAASVGVAWIKSFLVALEHREAESRIELAFAGSAPEPFRALVASKLTDRLRDHHNRVVVRSSDEGPTIVLDSGDQGCPRTAVLRSARPPVVVHTHAIKDGPKCEKTAARLARLVAARLAEPE